MYEILLDSSNKFLSVGIAKNGEVIDRIFYEAWQRQSEMMTGELSRILERNNILNNEIDAVVVGVGPGSYTGVRIAITIGKTIAYALNTKIYCVSSLSLLKNPNKPTICVVNARSGRSYFGVYDNTKVLVNDTIKPNEEVLSYIADHSDYQVNGEVEHLEIKSGDYDIIENLAKSMTNENLVKSPFELKPIYLKELTKWVLLTD